MMLLPALGLRASTVVCVPRSIPTLTAMVRHANWARHATNRPTRVSHRRSVSSPIKAIVASALQAMPSAVTDAKISTNALAARQPVTPMRSATTPSAVTNANAAQVLAAMDGVVTMSMNAQARSMTVMAATRGALTCPAVLYANVLRLLWWAMDVFRARFALAASRLVHTGPRIVKAAFRTSSNAVRRVCAHQARAAKMVQAAAHVCVILVSALTIRIHPADTLSSPDSTTVRGMPGASVAIGSQRPRIC